jgi:hypothetical protein
MLEDLEYSTIGRLERFELAERHVNSSGVFSSWGTPIERHAKDGAFACSWGHQAAYASFFVAWRLKWQAMWKSVLLRFLPPEALLTRMPGLKRETSILVQGPLQMSTMIIAL